MAVDLRYAKNAGAVFNLSYHIVWCPKYRRKVLVGDVEQRLKHILYATAQQYGVLIETMEVRPDHVHLLVSSDPTRCVAEIVNRLKGASSRIHRGEFPSLGYLLVVSFLLRWNSRPRFGSNGEEVHREPERSLMRKTFKYRLYPSKAQAESL